MKNISKRIVAIIVAVILMLTCVPVGIFTLAGGLDAPINHFFNFASESLYVEDSSLSKGNYSKDFGLSNGKCNITNNGTAFRYKDGELAGLRLLSGGSEIKAGKKLSVTKNTSYTIIVRMRTASNKKAFYLNIKESKTATENIVSIAADTSSSKKNYYVATFNSGDKDSVFLEFVAPANGSGLIYNLAIQAETTNFLDGGFESGNVNGGWVQNYPKDPVLVSGNEAKTGDYSMQATGYSEISAYVNVEPNTDYVITGNVKVTGTSNTNFQIQPMTNGMAVSSSNAISANNKYIALSEWQKVNVSFNSGDNSLIWLRLIVSDTTTTAVFDDISIKKIELPELNATDSLTKETNHILNFSSKELYTPILDDLVSNDFANADKTANITNNGSVVYVEDGLLSGMQINTDNDAIIQSATNLKVKPNTNYTLTVRMRSSKSKQLTVKAQTVDGLSDHAEITTNVSDKKVFTSSFVTGSEEFVKILVEMPKGGTGLIYYISLTEDKDVLQNGTFESGNLSGWVQAYTKAAEKDTENTHSGKYAMKLSGYSEYITYLTLKENTDYELSAYVKTDTKAYIRLRSLVNGVTPSTANMSSIIQKTATSSENYRKVVFRFNSENNTKVWLQLAVDEGETAYFDDISISVYNEPTLMEETKHYFSFADNELYVDTGVWNEKTSSNIFTNTDFALDDGSANISNSGVVSFYDDSNGIAGMRLNATGGTDLKAAKKLRVKPNTKYTVVTRMRTMTDNFALTLKLKKSDGITDYVTLTSSTDKSKYWYSAEFTTGDEEYLLLYFEAPKNSSGLVYTLSIQENTSILENGNFETGDTSGWVCDSNSDAAIINAKTENNSTNVKNGNAALKLEGYSTYSSYINVSPNTDYFWHGWVKTNGPTYVTAIEFQSGQIKSIGSAKNLVKQKMAVNDEWQEFTLTFNTGENSIVWLNLSVEVGSCAYFDDLRVQPLYDSIVDGDFEKSVDNWKNITESTADKNGIYKKDTTPVALSHKAHNGNSSLFLDGTNNMSSADYVMQVEKNTRYYVFFWGLATDFDAEVSVAGLNNEFSSSKKKNIGYSGEWQRYILSVDTGNNTLMTLKFSQVSGGKLYVDQLEFATSIKGTALPTAVVTETKSLLWVLKKDGKNLISNAGFESSVSGAMANFVNGKYAKRVKGENSAANGEYGLEFKASSNEVNSTVLWVNVEKNTNYVFSANVKSSYFSDTNRGNITFGVVDGVLGDYLLDKQGATYSLLPSAFDNEWHKLGFEFNSGNQSKIGIMITGANSEAWFDDLVLCLKIDAEKLKWGSNEATLSLENSYPKNIGCNPEDNLIGCYDFEGDLSFWEDGMGYERAFNIVDSKIDEAGKVLSFDSKDKPTYNRYVKWIEVKPNTEYTLSVMVRCDEDSLSSFSVFEKIYSGYASLIDVEAGEAEKKWKNIAFTFNTGDNTEIGLSFYDAGGSVVYNDIRLFETSKGVYMDVPTYGLVSTGDTTPEESKLNILMIALIIGVSLLVICGVLLVVFIVIRKRRANA